ncbi:MAG TPA: chloride channel protein, partial [Chloroflexi bacterium]|nr:chloride channel protein [Chloroflexota bacterium]
MQALRANQRMPVALVFIGPAFLVGVGGGLGAIAFRWLITSVTRVSFEWLPRFTQALGSDIHLILAPTLGGLLVGYLVTHYAPEAKGHGVPEVMEAVALRGGRIRPIVALIKSLASAICIGSGGSVGREGPIVQI